MNIETKDIEATFESKTHITAKMRLFGWTLKSESEIASERFEEEIKSDGSRTKKRIVERKLMLSFQRRTDNPNIIAIKTIEDQYPVMLAQLEDKRKQYADMNSRISSIESSITNLEAGYNPKASMTISSVIMTIVIFVAGIFIFKAIGLAWWWSFVPTVILTGGWVLVYRATILPKTSNPEYIKRKSEEMMAQAGKQKVMLTTQTASRDMYAKNLEAQEREFAATMGKVEQMMDGYWL